MVHFMTLYPPHPKKLTIDLQFESNRIHNHVPSFKTPPPHFHVDVINIWSFTPNIFKYNYLTYLSVAFSFQERKLKKRQYFKISTDSVDSFCTTNPRNWRKIEKTSY